MALLTKVEKDNGNAKVAAWHLTHKVERHVLAGQLALHCVECGATETVDSIEANRNAND